MQTATGLVEIDLLRTGDPIVPRQIDLVRPYAVYIDQVTQDGQAREQKLYLSGFTEPLPAIAVPLGPGTKPHILDLQAAFDRMFAGGPYGRGLVDYNEPPYCDSSRKTDTGRGVILCDDRCKFVGHLGPGVGFVLVG